MSRGPVKSSVLQYFELDKNEAHFICKIEIGGEKCSAKISAYTGSGRSGCSAPSRASNLKRHLQNKHSDIYNSVQKLDAETQKASSSRPGTSSSSRLSSSKPTSETVTNYFSSNKVTVTMNIETFKKHIIDSVVKNGIALTYFSSPACIGLIGEMATKLGLSLERHNIRNIILEEAKNQKTILKQLLQNKFFFLKMDACTRQRINYMAINVQFIDDNGDLAVRTLAVRDTEAQHSSEYIKNLIERILQEYDVEKNQILSIVTDNASNMTSAVDKLNIDEGDENLFEDTLEEDDVSFEFDTLDNAVNTFAGFFKIPHMRCAVHTLQLAIRDGLKERNIANVIARLRNIAVTARTPKLDAILKRRSGGKGAIIDQVTRWGSTFEMIQRLLELKEYLIDMANPDITMTDIQWKEASELENILKYPYIVTKNFQATELTPGTFFKEWKSIMYKLTHIGSIVAENIAQSMRQREDNLMNNDVLLAAIYVDPMHRVLLTPMQFEKGRNALCDIAVKIKVLTEKDFHNSPSHSESPTSSPILNEDSSNSDVEIDFDKYLDKEEKSKCSKRPRMCKTLKMKKTPLALFREQFIASLDNVEKFNRKSNMDVKTAIPKYPEMVQKAAMTVTALPPTQVSVERLFSALRLIKTHLRSKLKEDIMEAILFLRTNSN